MYGIIMTIISVIFLLQSLDDFVIVYMVLCFWISPIIASLSRTLCKNQSPIFSTFIVLLWSLMYIGSLLLLLLYSVNKYGLWDELIEQLWNLNMWAGLVAEFTLSLAVPVDFIESCILEFIPQGRSQVFIGGGASWGQINFSKNFSAKINKTSLNFKNFQKVLKDLKLIFNYVAIKNFLIFKIFFI